MYVRVPVCNYMYIGMHAYAQSVHKYALLWQKPCLISVTECEELARAHSSLMDAHAVVAPASIVCCIAYCSIALLIYV